jgi:hypothetical protein|tara:strand:+ start:1559 stop:1795 length:237 start_codon:yes stop_codon:yes gene_type:complete
MDLKISSYDDDEGELEAGGFSCHRGEDRDENNRVIVCFDGRETGGFVSASLTVEEACFLRQRLDETLADIEARPELED